MRAALAATALAALALCPIAGGEVRVSFGSTLAAAPTETEVPATCDPITGNDFGTCTRVAVGFAAGGAVVGQVRAPVSGVIRRIRLRSRIAGLARVTLARVNSLDEDAGSGSARVVSTGRTLHVRGKGSVETFRVKLRVRRGDYLALQGRSFGAMACRGGDVEQLVFQPALAVRRPAESTTVTDACTLLVQATVTAR